MMALLSIYQADHWEIPSLEPFQRNLSHDIIGRQYSESQRATNAAKNTLKNTENVERPVSSRQYEEIVLG